MRTSITMLMLTGMLCMASCSNDSPWETGNGQEGSITLSMTSDSRVMRGGTRADDTMCPIQPDGNAFGIKLTGKDGIYSKTWSNIEAFNKEKSFPMGDYDIEATYGDIDREGFELPAFKGVNSVHVTPGANTDVSVCATLANAMVSIRYTEKFTQNFKSYSAGVQTAGHSWVIFAQDETRPAFINPEAGENVKLSITMTNMAGNQVTIEPASFQALPRHHYVVTINAIGNVESGNLALDVIFDDEVVNETINVSLGDELFTAPAPEVRPKNFADKEELSYLEYESISTNPQFDILSFGGFGGVTLNVISENGYTPTFGGSVELLNAPEITQAQLEEAGVKVSGLYRNADKMAVVNIKSFLENLPAGRYTVEVRAKDAMTRLSEPVQITANVGAVDYSMTGNGNISFRGTEAVVDVNTNSRLLKDKIKFSVPDANNRMVEAPVKSVTEITPAQGAAPELPYSFRFVLELAPVSTPTVEVEAVYGKLKRNTVMTVNEPQYTVECDGFSRFVVLKVNADDAELLKYIVKNLNIYNGSSMIGAGNITRDVDNALITIKGLTPASNYESIKLSLGSFKKDAPVFTTEAETDVPNGNFSSGAERLTFNNLQVGGKYQTGAITYTTAVNINLDQPAGWANLNQLTFYTGSACKNSWFMVPSTYLNNGMVTVRSVGYSHNGKEPAKTGEFFSATYYNTNTPADGELTKQAGELFLGQYAFTGSENRENGISFGSRPASLSFDYKYTPVSGEQAQVIFKVIDASGNEIAKAEKSLSASSDMKKETISIASYPFGKKAVKLYVCFRSTKEGVTPSVNIPTGSQLKEWSGLPPTTPYVHHLDENSYHTYAVGSELVVDNVVLGYTNPVTVTKAKRRK